MMYDLSSEMSALVSAVMNRRALLELVKLDADDFYDEKCQLIFSALKAIESDRIDVDSMVLRERLIQQGTYEKAGGGEFLGAIMKHGHSIANIDHLVGVIRALSKRRKLITLSEQIRDTAPDRMRPTDELVHEYTEQLREIDKVDDDGITELSKLPEAPEAWIDQGKYIRTGFANIDKKIVGMFPGELFVLGARPGMGKSALAMCIARNVAHENSVLIFSLEMPERQWALRLIACESHLDSRSIRAGDISADDMQKIRRTVEKLRGLDITIADKIFTLDAIVNRTRKLAQYKPIDLIIIDYLQQVKVRGSMQRYIQIGEISRAFKMLARELDTRVLALSQLSRAADGRAPRLADLRESGDIEQDADCVIMLHHKDDTPKSEIDVYIEKHRSAATMRTKLLFQRQFTRFEDLEMRQQDYYQS